MEELTYCIKLWNRVYSNCGPVLAESIYGLLPQPWTKVRTDPGNLKGTARLMDVVTCVIKCTIVLVWSRATKHRKNLSRVTIFLMMCRPMLQLWLQDARLVQKKDIISGEVVSPRTFWTPVNQSGYSRGVTYLGIRGIWSDIASQTAFYFWPLAYIQQRPESSLRHRRCRSIWYEAEHTDCVWCIPVGVLGRCSEGGDRELTEWLVDVGSVFPTLYRLQHEFTVCISIWLGVHSCPNGSRVADGSPDAGE